MFLAVTQNVGGCRNRNSSERKFLLDSEEMRLGWNRPREITTEKVNPNTVNDSDGRVGSSMVREQLE